MPSSRENPFKLDEFLELCKGVDKECEYRRLITLDGPNVDEFGIETCTVGFGDAPHYEEMIANFDGQESNNELMAKAFQFLLNYSPQIAYYVKLGVEAEAGARHKKAETIDAVLALNRIALETLL